MRAMQTPRPWLGLLAGALAGLVASAVMEVAQAAVAKPKNGDGDGDGGDPATIKAANAVSEATVGTPIAERYRDPAGDVVHYAAGAALGALYGLLVEYRSHVAAGFGTAYGAAVSVILDEAIVPAVGLGSAPWRTSARTHLFGLASHLVFGVTLEAARQSIARRI